MRRPALVSLLIALGLVVGTTLVIFVSSKTAAAPVRAQDAGLTGEVWVMPSKDVAAFLHRHDVELGHPVDPGTTVVGRVSWTGRQGGSEDRFTILLGDERGGAGRITEVLGLPDAEVSLSSGSMWNATTDAHSWLKDDGPLKLEGGGYTSHGQFASIPTSVAKDVWFLADVLDVSDPRTPVAVLQPKPVVGVALSTGDHVWWVHRVTST